MSTDEERPDEEDDVPLDFLSPNEDVFSYFMLASPTEKMKHNHFTVDACMSYMLVCLTLLMQAVLLFCVYDKVIVKNTSWHNGIVNTGQDWNLVAPARPACNDGQSLCQVVNGVLTCAPPSVQLISHWDELDTDKDGIWTLVEAMAEREALRCKYVVDPVEVFHVMGTLLKEREEHIWIHPDVKSGKAVHKNYFTYIMGDIALCGYRNEDMCGNLLNRGVFDAPLNNSNVPRVGGTITSALDYCHNLLDQGGLCERILPSTYATWKIESVQECHEPKYRRFVKKDPSDGHVKSLLEVDYAARQDYEMAQTPGFIAYKTCIIFVWILLIVSQIREVWKTMTWVAAVAKHRASENGPLSPTEKERGTYGMSQRHKTALGIVTFVRICMLCVLLYVGLNFLGRSTEYIGLLLDGVALIFIVEVAHILYERVLRQEKRTHWEQHEPIEIQKKGLSFLTRRPDITDMLWLLVVVFGAGGFLMFYTTTTVKPLYDALQCACLSQGESCHEAHAYSNTFWDQYWGKDVPASIQSIDDLKAVWASLPKSTAPAVNLLKFHHSHSTLGHN